MMRAPLPQRVAALFWARIALSCSRNAHPIGFQAAESAARLYRQLRDDGRLYDALTWAIAIGARLAEPTPLAPLVAEAETIEDPEWPLRTQASFQWAKHRWLLREGRYEDAMNCARAGGTAASGRMPSPRVARRVAIWNGRGKTLRPLEPLALNAARAGRFDAAALVLGHVDAVRCRRGEIRWPPAAERRALLGRQLSAALPPVRLRILEKVGAALRRDQAFAHAFGDADALAL